MIIMGSGFSSHSMSEKIKRREKPYIDVVEAMKWEVIEYIEVLEKNNLLGNHSHRSIPVKLKNIEKETSCDCRMIGKVLRTFFEEEGIQYKIGGVGSGKTYHLLLSRNLIVSWRELYK